MRRSIEIENLLKRIRETEAERDLAIKDRDNALKIANMNHAQWERAEAKIVRLVATLDEIGRCSHDRASKLARTVLSEDLSLPAGSLMRPAVKP